MTTDKPRVAPLGRFDLLRPDPSASQLRPMRAKLEVDTRTGALAIIHLHQADHAVPAAVCHSIVLRLPIPSDADGAVLTEAINAGKIDDLIAAIVTGSLVEWNGHNHCNITTDDAEDAIDTLREWLQAQGGAITGGLWAAGDWLVDGADSVPAVTGRAITVSTSDEDLAAIAAALEAAARSEDIVLCGALQYLQALRGDLRDAHADAG